MAKNFQISYIIEAVDKASKTLEGIEKKLKKLDKAYEKSHKKAAVGSKKMAKSMMSDDSAISKARKTHLSEYVKDMKKEGSLENRRMALSKRRTAETIRNEKSITRETERAARQRVSIINRAEKDNIRRDKRIDSTRARGLDRAGTAASRSLMYVTAPTAAASVLSLKNYAMLEQMELSLKTKFGEKEGPKVFTEMKDFARETAFTLRESVRLVSDLKIAKKTLTKVGVTSTEGLVNITKQFGNLFLSYGNTREDRQEIANQVGQVGLAGKASSRQDLRVMSRRGLPIFEGIEAYTGMDFDAVKQKFGAEIPAEIVYNSLLEMSNSPLVARNIKLRQESFSQAWDIFSESALFFSGEYGGVLNKQFSIAKKLRGMGDLLAGATEKLKGNSKEAGGALESAIGFGTAWAVSVPAIALSSIMLAKIVKMGGGLGVIGTHFLRASAIMGAMYLTTVDWEDVIDDIKNKGFAGWIQHLDVVLASFLVILQTAKAIRAVSIGAAAATATGVAGGTAAAGAAGVGSYFGFRKLISMAGDAIEEEEFKRMGINPRLGERNEARLIASGQYKRGWLGDLKPGENYGKPEDRIVVNNNIQVDKSGMVTGKTEIKSNAFSNPISYELGD